MTVNTYVIQILLSNNSLPFIEIEDGLHIQVLPSMSYLPQCQKRQFAAFVADRGLLVVGDDDPEKIVGRVRSLETALVKMIWYNNLTYPKKNKKKEPVLSLGWTQLDWCWIHPSRLRSRL